jgi:hypothetical protein
MTENTVPHRKVVTVDNMNPHLKKMEYAVRGPIVARAAQIENELKKVSYVLHPPSLSLCCSIPYSNLPVD